MTAVADAWHKHPRAGNLSLMTEFESLPLPDDPMLAAWASTVNAGGYWAQVYDASWRLVFVTDDLRLSLGDTGPISFMSIGSHFFSAEVRQSWVLAGTRYGGRGFHPQPQRTSFLSLGRYVLGSTPGGREELRRLVDPKLADLVDELQPEPLPPAWFSGAQHDTVAGVAVVNSTSYFRIDDAHGDLAGVCAMTKPAAGMSQLAVAAYTLDLAHLERLGTVEPAGRHPAAVLMADLESSSPLARTLSTAQYFAFARRLVRAIDQCIIDAGGIVGRHTGDGVVAFFLAETAGSESGATRACITSALTVRDTLPDVAARSEIGDAEVSLRFGLHWGATLYMGRILTGGRSEVTALGDEVNETARIEASATGGRTLASKPLIERLNAADAEALGLDTSHMKYTPLADLATATNKARRDAPAIAVCEL